MLAFFVSSHEATLTSILLLGDVDRTTVKILHVGSFVNDLLAIVIMNILVAGSHLTLHEALGSL